MSKRVMIVDDSRLVRVQLGDVLEGTDYEIAAYCRSGEDAIAQYDEVNPDLVTMDIIMQGMDGLDPGGLCLSIGSRHLGSGNPPRVVCTGESVDYRS